jgi:gas vesicle protein
MKNASKILIALGAGLAIGGLLGVLFAPAKGAETRKKISDSSKKLADKLNSRIKEGKQKLVKEMGNINGEMGEA